jgi:hypothetical protein
MASESTGTHKDPVTGEMISKQYVVVLLIISCFADRDKGNSSAVKNRERRKLARQARRWKLQLPAKRRRRQSLVKKSSIRM